jgi:hypothetical protein
MKAQKNGFELVFTEPVDKKTAENVASYEMKTFTYIYQGSYGSPEVDPTTPTITSAKLSDDGKRVQLVIDGLQRGHVHHLVSKGIVSAKDKSPLLHRDAYYTLNYMP